MFRIYHDAKYVKMSSTKSEIHNISHCHMRTKLWPQSTHTENLVKFSHVTFWEICNQTYRQTDRQTDRLITLLCTPPERRVNMQLNTHSSSGSLLSAFDRAERLHIKQTMLIDRYFIFHIIKYLNITGPDLRGAPGLPPTGGLPPNPSYFFSFVICVCVTVCDTTT